MAEKNLLSGSIEIPDPGDGRDGKERAWEIRFIFILLAIILRSVIE